MSSPVDEHRATIYNSRELSHVLTGSASLITLHVHGKVFEGSDQTQEKFFIFPGIGRGEKKDPALPEQTLRKNFGTDKINGSPDLGKSRCPFRANLPA